MAMGQFRRLAFSMLLLAMFSTRFSTAELPKELDPFLERLFETPECEKFLADGSFLAVATRECPPYRCAFPRQLCMRPSAEYQKEEANQCRDLPEPCLLAANGGQPLPSAPSPANLGASSSTDSPALPPPMPPQPVDRLIEKPPPPSATPTPNIQAGSNRPQPPNPAPSPPPLSHGPICEQGPPEGRFCGFSLKFAYNRETRSCDQFWFPGCRTERTNENLFDTLGQCLQAVRHCARADPIFRPQPPMGIGHQGQGQPRPPPPAPPEPTAFNGGNGQGPYLGGQLPPSPPQPFNGGPQPGQPETPFGQAGNFIRLITNTIREVRERGNGGGGNGGQQGGGGGGGLRWDPSQLGGLLQSLGGRRK